MKVVFKHRASYAEEHQDNPLLWMILSKKGEDLHQESGWLKCKDFFNDLAYTIQTGKNFTIYGFNAGTMNPPKKDEPVYMLIKGIQSAFFHNLSVVNSWLSDKKLPEIYTLNQEDQAEIQFDPFYFKNTYNISLISLMLRVINCTRVFSSFEEICKAIHLPAGTGDRWKWDAVVKKGVFFNLPEKLKDYVWYCGPERNSKKPGPEYSLSNLVHNNGVIDWSNYF